MLDGHPYIQNRRKEGMSIRNSPVYSQTLVNEKLRNGREGVYQSPKNNNGNIVGILQTVNCNSNISTFQDLNKKLRNGREGV